VSPARLYLVRHAAAEPGGAGGDAARRLTGPGRAAFEALLRALAGELAGDAAVRRVLSSPLVRARETAALLAAACGATVEEEPALRSGASSGAELLALARRTGAGAALVGHNPEIAEAVARVAGRELSVPPGTVAAVDVDGGGRVSLAWLRAP
jgi:phosphohistidine phosphatase